MAGAYNLKIEKGATFRRVLTWKDSDGNLVNLTGYTAKLKIRPRATSSDVIIALTETSGITLGGALGTIEIIITAAQSADIEDTSGAYDLVLTAGSGATRLIAGTVQFIEEVSR